MSLRGATVVQREINGGYMVTLTHIPQNELTHKLAGSLLAFYDWLSGAPMTERERVQREIAEAHTHITAISGSV